MALSISLRSLCLSCSAASSSMYAAFCCRTLTDAFVAVARDIASVHCVSAVVIACFYFWIERRRLFSVTEDWRRIWLIACSKRCFSAAKDSRSTDSFFS